jgi:hypothetical protein
MRDKVGLRHASTIMLMIFSVVLIQAREIDTFYLPIPISNNDTIIYKLHSLSPQLK